jgi:Fe-S-cluster containining protein
VSDLDCQSCAACCKGHDKTPAYVPLMVSEETRLPAAMVIRSDSGRAYLRMRHDRTCVALDGTPGERATCSIYEQRPKVCRDYEPGGYDCLRAREMEGMT